MFCRLIVSRRSIIRGISVVTVMLAAAGAVAQPVFRVHPYLQPAGPDEMTIRWFTTDSVATSAELYHPDGRAESREPATIRATALVYSEWERAEHPVDIPPAPYRHTATFGGLHPSTRYRYTVQAADSVISAWFTTPPTAGDSLRLIIYGDAETEPESRGKHAPWGMASGDTDRTYLIDQAEGYRENLRIIAKRRPDLILVTGDLVRIGNEQRDWDAFWRANTHPDSSRTIGGRFPLLPVLGNHEYLAPHVDRDDKFGYPQSETAVARYLTYFSLPTNDAPFSEQEGRYYRLDYGEALLSIIGLDVNNNPPQGSSSDTNIFLTSYADGEEGWAPAFSPGSAQYTWLEAQLADARIRSALTFVMLHYVPYSSGIHGLPAGSGPGEDPLSGRPVRALMPLFLEYGVDAVFAGHGEMLERSVVSGIEQSATGPRDHMIHVYDVGIGGDHLRGPDPDVDNPFGRFLAVRDAPEVWENEVLVDGGAHYGHLEVNIGPAGNGMPSSTTARIEPVYVFPVVDASGVLSHTERRIYDDVVVLKNEPGTGTGTDREEDPMIQTPGPEITLYPQPAGDRLRVRFASQNPIEPELTIYDVTGRNVSATIERSGTVFVIDTSGLAEGLYGIELRVVDRRIRQTFVVKK